MINILDIDNFIELNDIMPVTNINIYDNDNNYTIDGIFSEEIFGEKHTKLRQKKYGYIDLDCFIFNPLILNMLMKMEHKIKNIINLEKYYVLDDNGILIEDKENGETGITFLHDIINRRLLNLRPYNDKREKNSDYIYNNLDKVFIDKWLVIPPYYRENAESEDYRSVDELNGYYLSLLKLSGEKNKNDIVKWSIQKVILNIFEYIKNKISKKEGHIRGNTMAKRVDFSGRSVIVSNYNLKINQAGIPYEMLIKLFEPFIIHEMLNNSQFDSYGINELTIILNKVYNKAYDNEEIRKIVKKVIQDKVVLLKRDPALHRGSVQAFNPIIANEDAIEIHPAVVGPFNADFDGDSISGTKVKLEIKKDNKTTIIMKDISQLSELKL